MYCTQQCSTYFSFYLMLLSLKHFTCLFLTKNSDNNLQNVYNFTTFIVPHSVMTMLIVIYPRRTKTETSVKQFSFSNCSISWVNSLLMCDNSTSIQLMYKRVYLVLTSQSFTLALICFCIENYCNSGYFSCFLHA